MGQKMTLVIESDSGIKNPSEAGTHSVFFDLVGSADPYPLRRSNVSAAATTLCRAADPFDGAAPSIPWPRSALSDVDNKRGYEMTVTGSGFNDGTTAAVYVLAHARYQTAKWWQTLDCAEMKEALGKADSDTDEACLQLRRRRPANMSYDAQRPAAWPCPTSSNLDADMIGRCTPTWCSTQHLCRIIVEGKTFNVTKDDGTG